MALSDAVAAQVMGEMHLLTKDIEAQAQRIEQVAATVVAAAKAVNAGRTVLHAQNEKLLMDQVTRVTSSIAELKGMEDAMQKAARAQADAAVSPLVKALQDKETQAIKYYVSARDVYKTLSDKIISAMVIMGICFAVAVASSFYVGMKIGALNAGKAESQPKVGNQK